MYRRILVALDGSPTSQRALREAIRVAAAAKAQLRLLHVLDAFLLTLRMQSSGAPGRAYAAMRAAAHDRIARADAAARAAGLKASGRVVENFSQRVSDLILREAKAWRADLLVLGTHGRRGLSRLVLGSDAEQVVRRSSVPVLLVRGKD
jgi:nucleotide-binding universal stress UspA family protein